MQPYYRNGTRVVVVAGAESLTTDAGNALLKLLEEPPPRTIFVLTAVAAEQLLPTVRSRCAAIYFPLPPRPQVVQLITARSGLSPAQAAQIADAASGAPGAALALAADPNHAQQQIQLAAQAEMTLHEHNRYLRLRQAAALATSPEATAHFARLLHRHLVETMRRPGTDLQSAGCSLAALERCRQQLAAKVAPKVALERLMLELS